MKQALRLTCIVGCVGIIAVIAMFQSGAWVAPEEANKLVNPVSANAKATAEGQRIYEEVCWKCHGDKGKGNGQAGVNLDRDPANFTTAEFQKQTDGAIFWKITEGRAPMASYKTKLSEVQRWSLVNYLRQFSKTAAKDPSR
jgi:mono/diheme cytochrome c family protein